MYVAIKADVIRSRSAKNRQQLQTTLFHAVDVANARFQDDLAANFIATHGDEVQGLLPLRSVHVCLHVCEHFIDSLHPEQIRFGIGIGSLATELQPVAIGMDGESWHRAQVAIERSRKRRLIFMIESGQPAEDRAFTAIIDYMLSHRATWTASQREAVHWLEQLGTQQAVAAHLHISDAAVSKRLSACMWHKYEALREVAQKECLRYVAEHTSGSPNETGLRRRRVKPQEKQHYTDGTK